MRLSQDSEAWEVFQGLCDAAEISGAIRTGIWRWAVDGCQWKAVAREMGVKPEAARQAVRRGLARIDAVVKLVPRTADPESAALDEAPNPPAHRHARHLLEALRGHRGNGAGFSLGYDRWGRKLGLTGDGPVTVEVVEKVVAEMAAKRDRSFG